MCVWEIKVRFAVEFEMTKRVNVMSPHIPWYLKHPAQHPANVAVREGISRAAFSAAKEP
jgi:hypothetical protein